jgi:shikimate kinase
MGSPFIEIRRPWRADEAVFLLGPGGVGKSSLGRVLAKALAWPLVDLDLEFCVQIATIGAFIQAHGYERYRAENLALAGRLVASCDRPMLFVTSSGFLAARPGTHDYIEARRLVSTGYGITLLPSLDADIATSIVVERQLARGFELKRETETAKFRERFGLYRDEGNMLVVSTDPAEQIGAAVLRTLEK